MENIERLRVISCFFIILLHVWAPVRLSVSGQNRNFCTIVNGICNTGVSCFVLISGFFGVKLKWRRIVELTVAASGYSLLALGISCLLGVEKYVSVGALLKASFPIIFNQNWFICCYIALLLFSPFINEYLDSISIQKHLYLCVTLLIIFSIIPTFFYYELPGTSCKGLFHIIMVYTIGKFIAKWGGMKKIRTKMIILLLICSVGITILANFALLLFTGEDKEYFSRDCSVFIIISSILIFLITLKASETKVKYTKVSRYCLDIYLIHDSLVLAIFNYFIFDFSKYLTSWKIIVFTILEGILCLFVSYVISLIFHPCFSWLSDKIYTICRNMWDILEKKIKVLLIK